MSAVRFKPKEWAAFVAEHGIQERNGEAVRPFKRRFALPRVRKVRLPSLPRSVALWYFCGVTLAWNVPLLLLSSWEWCAIYTFGLMFGLVVLQVRLKAARGSKAENPPDQSTHIE